MDATEIVCSAFLSLNRMVGLIAHFLSALPMTLSSRSGRLKKIISDRYDCRSFFPRSLYYLPRLLYCFLSFSHYEVARTRMKRKDEKSRNVRFRFLTFLVSPKKNWNRNHNYSVNHKIFLSYDDAIIRHRPSARLPFPAYSSPSYVLVSTPPDVVFSPDPAIPLVTSDELLQFVPCIRHPIIHISP